MEFLGAGREGQGKTIFGRKKEFIKKSRRFLRKRRKTEIKKLKEGGRAFKYRVFLKKVSFGVFSIIMVFKEDKNFTMKSKDKMLSLGKFS